MKDRLGWVDYAKGIGIILVVAAHNLGGQRNAGLPMPHFVEAVSQYAYSFHMPLFFFLSGLFVEQSLRKGSKPFLSSKVATVFYPFVLWSLIQGTIQGLLSRYTNHRINLFHDLPFFLVRPIGQMWFLESLFLMLVFYALARSVKVPAAALIALSLVLALCAGFVQNPLLHRTASDFIFLVAGIPLRTRAADFLRTARMPILAVIAAAAFCAQIALVFGAPGLRAIPGVITLTSAIGILSVIALSGLLNRTSRGAWLLFVGQYSLAIYLMHVIVGAGIRIVSARFFHITNTWFHAGAELAGGVLVPIFVTMLVTKWHGDWVFEWPRRRPERQPVDLIAETPS